MYDQQEVGMNLQPCTSAACSSCMDTRNNCETYVNYLCHIVNHIKEHLFATPWRQVDKAEQQTDEGIGKCTNILSNISPWVPLAKYIASFEVTYKLMITEKLWVIISRWQRDTSHVSYSSTLGYNMTPPHPTHTHLESLKHTSIWPIMSVFSTCHILLHSVWYAILRSYLLLAFPKANVTWLSYDSPYIEVKRHFQMALVIV